jgi:hypothetical protein
MKNQSGRDKKAARLRRITLWLSALTIGELDLLLGPPSAMRIPVFYHEQHQN